MAGTKDACGGVGYGGVSDGQVATNRMIVMSLILFLQGWAIFWDAVGPELKWVETVSVENTIGLLKGMQEQGMLADEMDTDAMVDYAISPASDRLRQDLGDAY